jgi:hypothetical protein
MIKIIGRSIINEFVTCYKCKKKFVWLYAMENIGTGVYVAGCAKCRKEEKRRKRGIRI